MADKKKALKYFNKGQLSQAEKIYLKACKANPKDPEAHYMLGSINGQRGLLDRAEIHFKKCIELQPQSAMSHLCLGGVYKSSKPEAAADLFLKAYQLNPQLLDAYYEYASTQYMLNQHQLASDACFEILKKNPDYFNANLLLGNIKLEARDNEGAIKYYKGALKANPSFGEAYYQLGNLYYRIGQFESALDNFEESLKYITNNYNPYISYGRALITVGDMEKAEAIYNKALKINRNDVDAISGIASVHEYNKDYDKANELLLPIIEKCEQPSINIIGTYEKICKKFDTCAQLLKYIDFVEAQDVNIDWYNRCIIFFTKANLYEKSKQYSLAFAEFKKANDLVPDEYNKTTYELQVNDLKSTYSYEYMLQRKKTSSDEKYIFIVGMPRSGTSLIEQILDSHSLVYGAGELPHIQNLTKSMLSKGDNLSYPKCMPSMEQSTLQHYADAYTKEIRKLSDKSYIVDKMPHNHLHVGLISQLFPKSKIIHCKRNPIDTCLSIYFQNFNDTHAYANNLLNIAHHYKVYSDVMQHWNSLLSDKIYTVSYEDMISDFDTQSKALIEFCDLEWEDSCAEFYKNKRHVNTASQSQVNQPLYTSSVARWTHYEDEIGELIGELKKYKLID